MQKKNTPPAYYSFLIAKALCLAAICFISPVRLAAQATSGSSISLPVKLEYFHIFLTAPKKVELEWKTAEQFTNVVYELQRAVDNYNFSTIGTITPPDNSATTRVYNFTDDFSAVLVKKVLFYRIKQIQNAKISYSDVKAFRFTADKSGPLVEAFPSPVASTLQVNIYTEKKTEASITAVDMSGKILFTKVVAAEEGNNTYNIDETASISKGVFFLRVFLDGKLQSVKKMLKL